MSDRQRTLKRPFFIKLFYWEYWSFGMIYTWIYPVWFFLCLRARSFFFFSASNPSIKNGGFLNESKKDICAVMPQDIYPLTVFFNAGTKEDIVLKQLKEKGLFLPVIGKPDIGGRGRGVKLLQSETDVMHYAHNTTVDFHIQEYIAFKKETGIFYYRYPCQQDGKLSGIVRKEFLQVRGDGTSTIRQLLNRNQRALLQMKTLQKTYGDELDIVLPPGAEKIIVPYGNHSRGSEFLDDSHLIDEELTATMNKICSRVKDFYYGRLDIKYNSWEELKQGKNFSVIEINGAGAEPTHIYDPKHSLLFAWKEIIRHWIILWRISRMNHKKGYPYLTVKEGIAMFRQDKQHSVKLASMMK